MDLFNLISADAGMCSREHAQFLAEKGLHYLFVLKNPQSHLNQSAKAKLEGLLETQSLAETKDRLGQKYTVIRRLYLTSELAGKHDWESLKTVLRVESLKIENQTGEIVSGEDRYFLSDLDQNSLTPIQWLKMIRAHWSVENDCHGTLDTAFEEDTRPWIKADGQGFLVVLLLRRIALNVLSLFRSAVSRQAKAQGSPRKVAWKLLLEWCYLALLGSLEDKAESSKESGVSDITLV